MINRTRFRTTAFMAWLIRSSKYITKKSEMQVPQDTSLKIFQFAYKKIPEKDVYIILMTDNHLFHRKYFLHTATDEV